MIDYGPGDEIVCVYEPKLHKMSPFKLNKLYVCEALEDINSIPNYAGQCRNCNNVGAMIVYVVGYALPIIEGNWRWMPCSCFFKKKLDFKSLCNVKDAERIPA